MAFERDSLNECRGDSVLLARITSSVVGDAASVKPQLDKLGLPVEVREAH